MKLFLSLSQDPSNPSADQIAEPAEGFVPLYTGADLSGWKVDPGHVGHWQPEDWKLVCDGKSEAVAFRR